MARKVHVLIPYTTQAACGDPGFSANAGCREIVTCALCKKTAHYKNLPNAPRRFRLSKRMQRS